MLLDECFLLSAIYMLILMFGRRQIADDRGPASNMVFVEALVVAPMLQAWSCGFPKARA